MIVGRWDVAVDDMWRITIPHAVHTCIDFTVFLRLNENGCIEIHPKSRTIRVEDAPYIHEVRAEKTNREMRVLVPCQLRDSTSFFFGRHVTIAGRVTYFELWPRKYFFKTRAHAGFLFYLEVRRFFWYCSATSFYGACSSVVERRSVAAVMWVRFPSGTQVLEYFEK